MARIVLFGNDVYEAQRVRKIALLGDKETYPSEVLCRWQISESKYGICEAEIVESFYGYSVRYASGIMNFGIIAGCRSGQLDGSWEAACAFAKDWQARVPGRYVTTSERVAEAAA